MTFLWRTPGNRFGLIVYAVVLLVLALTFTFLSAIWVDVPFICTTAAMDLVHITVYVFLPYLSILLILANIRYKPKVFIFKFNWSIWELIALVGTLPGLILCVPFVTYWFRMHRWWVGIVYVLMMHLLLMLRATTSNKQRRAAAERDNPSDFSD